MMNDIENFEILFQMMPNYGFIVRQSGRVVSQNTLASKTFGKDIIYIPFYIKSDSRLSQELFTDITKAALKEQNNIGSVKLIDIYGVVRDCELRISEINFQSEFCYLIVLQDRMEILKAHTKYDKTFELNTIPILISNFDTGEFLDVNSAALRLFNYSRDEVIGQKAYQFIQNASPDFRVSYFTELIRKGKVDDFTMRILSKDGFERTCLVSLAVVAYNDEKFVLTSIKDISKFVETEGKYSLLFESIKFGIVCHNQTGQIMDANPAAGEILGLTHDQLMGRTPLDSRWKALKDDGSEFPADEHPAMITLKTGEMQKNVLMAIYEPIHNKYKWIKIDSIPIFSDNNPTVPQLVYAVFEDISTVKEYNEQILILNQSVEQSPVSIVITDKLGNIEYINPKFCQTTGYSKEELIGKNPRILKSGELPDSVYIDLWDTISSGKSWTGELVNRNKAGELFWEMVSISPIINEFGQISHFVGIKENITARKQAAEELEFNLIRMQSLVNILQHSVGSINDLLDFALEEAIKLTKSKIGYIYFYNESTQLFTLNSWSKGVMNECTIAEKHRHYKLNQTGLWGEAVRQRKTIIINNFEEDNPFKKGYPEGHAHLEKFLTVPIYSNGEIVAVVGVANKKSNYNETDKLQLTLLMDAVWRVVEKEKSNEEVNILLQEVTIAKEQTEVNLAQKNILVEELETTKLRLIDSLKEKDKFFSIIAHDLRSPFSGFLGFTKIMAEEIQDLSLNEIQEISERMQDSAKTLYLLLENLLEWSRMKRNSIAFAPEYISITFVIKTNISLIKLRADIKGVEIENSVPENLMLNADMNLLNGVIRNLLSNALKFTPNGGYINIGTIDGVEDLTIYIKDSGIGMPASVINKLFKIDEKVSRLGTDGESSTGLGLLLCKEYVDKHGGKIWAESAEGKGSTFFVSLPKNIE